MLISANNKSTLATAVEELKRLDETLHRQRVPLDELRFAEGKLLIPNRQLTLDDTGFRRFCQEVGAPHAYLAELRDDLRARILAWHLEKGDLARRHPGGQVCVYWRNSTFLGFGRADLTTLTGADVLYSVEQGIHEQLRLEGDQPLLHRFKTDEESFQLEIALPSVSEEMRPDDAIQGGLRVCHSLLGGTATRIETFLLRLVCQNGLVSRECVQKAAFRLRRCSTRNRDAPSHQLTQIVALTRRVVRGLHNKLDSLKSLTDHEVEVRDFLDQQLRQVPRLHSRALRNRLLEAWAHHGRGNTAYAALNAITWVATHAPDAHVKPRQREALALLAGVIALSGQHICPRCYSVIAA